MIAPRVSNSQPPLFVPWRRHSRHDDAAVMEAIVPGHGRVRVVRPLVPRAKQQSDAPRSSSATGDVGVPRTGSRIIGAMQLSATCGETSGPRPEGKRPALSIRGSSGCTDRTHRARRCSRGRPYRAGTSANVARRTEPTSRCSSPARPDRLCRCRHNRSHAERLVMPSGGPAGTALPAHSDLGSTAARHNRPR